jgi:cyclophilin family peptidyl-prolyl cis-trans isomerase
VNRPVMLTVTAPPGQTDLTLIVLNASGQPELNAIQVRAGRIDLAEMFPDGGIWKLERAGWLQLLGSDGPIGSALVVQPLLSRMVPQTQIASRANGSPYSKVTRWLDENALPPLTTPTTVAATQPDQSATKSADATSAKQSKTPESKSSESKTPETKTPPKRLLSGLRIYPDSDVIMHTSKGDIQIAMRPDEAPNTAWNFLTLARDEFFRDVVFHRIVPFTAKGEPFVIQAGDPTGTGDGGPGYWLPLEDSHLPHDFGVISMARSDDPDSAGSQFFFCLSREGTARLDGQYCSFGYAVRGAETIKAIAAVELANVAEGKPVDPPVISSVDIVPAPPLIPGRGRPDQRVSAQSEQPAEPTTKFVPR